MRLSVVIITLNEEHNIERCIRSAKEIADEILVVDSHSGDATVNLAEALGARVVLKRFTDYVAQKNFAMSQAEHDWILSLDADEVVSAELLQQIKQVKEQPEFQAYRFKRLTNYCGQWIRHCGWYPDKKVRLFDRTKGKWEGNKIHEQWLLHTHQPVGELAGDLHHYSFNTVADHFIKVTRYTDILADIKAERGKPIPALKMWLSPLAGFLTSYLIKAGFMDGYNGFLICKISAYATYLKYKKARAIMSCNRQPTLSTAKA